jgi:hypothetical protein
MGLRELIQGCGEFIRARQLMLSSGMVILKRPDYLLKPGGHKVPHHVGERFL